MKHFIALVLMVIFCSVLYLPVNAKADNANSDIIEINFTRTEVYSYETLEIPYEIKDPNATILNVTWHSPQQTNYYYPTELQGVFRFQPIYHGNSYLIFSIQTGDGKIVQKKTHTFFVHGIEINTVFGINSDCLQIGDTQTIDYTITGGTGKYSVTTEWEAILDEEVTNSVYLNKKTSTASSGHMELNISESMWYVNFSIYVTDDKGSISLKNINTSWRVQRPGSQSQTSSDPSSTEIISSDPTSAPTTSTEIISLKKINIKKLTALSSKKIRVDWKKLSSKDRKKIQKIQIQVSTDKSFSKIVKKKTVSSSKSSCTISGLKKNTKYYIRIRAYTKSGKTINISKWSIKSKKTKKK